MKIGIFSDTHLGFGEKGERYDESFGNLVQAINLCISEGADFIAIAGDIFDAPVPSHDTLYRSMVAFAAAEKGSSAASFAFEKNGETKNLKFNCIPILAIHGNHEYAGKDTRTALDVLSVSNCVFYFHAGKIIAEKNGEKCAVFGLGAVPEKKALDALHHWAPRPEKGASNILMTHQGFKEFMAIEDDMIATLSLDDLPEGFDLYVNGHLHWQQEHKVKGGIFLLPGSTIATSIKKIEAGQKKGVHFFDTAAKKISFVPFENQRAAFYFKSDFKGAEVGDIAAWCRKTIDGCLAAKHSMKPLIRLNLKGTLKKGLSHSDVNLAPLIEEYSGHAILSVSKNFSSLEFSRKIADLREMQRSKLSIAAMGLEILEKNLKETDFGKEISASELLDSLAESDLEKALSQVTKR